MFPFLPPTIILDRKFSPLDGTVKLRHQQFRGKRSSSSEKGQASADTASEYTDKIKNYDSDITALKALSSGRHDAVITDFVTREKCCKGRV